MIDLRDVIAARSKFYHIPTLKASSPTLALCQLEQLFIFVGAVTLVRGLLALHTRSGRAMTACADIGGH
jgi:hypothetical protein